MPKDRGVNPERGRKLEELFSASHGSKVNCLEVMTVMSFINIKTPAIQYGQISVSNSA